MKKTVDELIAYGYVMYSRNKIYNLTLELSYNDIFLKNKESTVLCLHEQFILDYLISNDKNIDIIRLFIEDDNSKIDILMSKEIDIKNVNILDINYYEYCRSQELKLKSIYKIFNAEYVRSNNSIFSTGRSILETYRNITDMRGMFSNTTGR